MSESKKQAPSPIEKHEQQQQYQCILDENNKNISSIHIPSNERPKSAVKFLKDICTKQYQDQFLKLSSRDCFSNHICQVQDKPLNLLPISIKCVPTPSFHNKEEQIGCLLSRLDQNQSNKFFQNKTNDNQELNSNLHLNLQTDNNESNYQILRTSFLQDLSPELSLNFSNFTQGIIQEKEQSANDQKKQEKLIIKHNQQQENFCINNEINDQQSKINATEFDFYKNNFDLYKEKMLTLINNNELLTNFNEELMKELKYLKDQHERVKKNNQLNIAELHKCYQEKLKEASENEGRIKQEYESKITENTSRINYLEGQIQNLLDENQKIVEIFDIQKSNQKEQQQNEKIKQININTQPMQTIDNSQPISEDNCINISNQNQISLKKQNQTSFQSQHNSQRQLEDETNCLQNSLEELKKNYQLIMVSNENLLRENNEQQKKLQQAKNDITQLQQELRNSNEEKEKKIEELERKKMAKQKQNIEIQTTNEFIISYEANIKELSNKNTIFQEQLNAELSKNNKLNNIITEAQQREEQIKEEFTKQIRLQQQQIAEKEKWQKESIQKYKEEILQIQQESCNIVADIQKQKSEIETQMHIIEQDKIIAQSEVKILKQKLMEYNEEEIESYKQSRMELEVKIKNLLKRIQNLEQEHLTQLEQIKEISLKAQQNLEFECEQKINEEITKQEKIINTLKGQLKLSEEKQQELGREKDLLLSQKEKLFQSYQNGLKEIESERQEYYTTISETRKLYEERIESQQEEMHEEIRSLKNKVRELDNEVRQTKWENSSLKIENERLKNKTCDELHHKNDILMSNQKISDIHNTSLLNPNQRRQTEECNNREFEQVNSQQCNYKNFEYEITQYPNVETSLTNKNMLINFDKKFYSSENSAKVNNQCSNIFLNQNQNRILIENQNQQVTQHQKNQCCLKQKNEQINEKQITEKFEINAEKLINQNINFSKKIDFYNRNLENALCQKNDKIKGNLLNKESEKSNNRSEYASNSDFNNQTLQNSQQNEYLSEQNNLGKIGERINSELSEIKNNQNCSLKNEIKYFLSDQKQVINKPINYFQSYKKYQNMINNQNNKLSTDDKENNSVILPQLSIQNLYINDKPIYSLKANEEINKKILERCKKIVDGSLY